MNAAEIIGWIVLFTLGILGFFLVADGIARLMLAFIMTNQWRHEDSRAYDDDDDWKQR